MDLSKLSTADKLILGGGIAYLALRDTGEDNREAYCAALRDLTDNGDLTSAINDADQQTVDDVSDAEMADAMLLALAGVPDGPAIDMDGPVVEPPPAAMGGESAIPPLHLSV